jgi:hypothetical protein
MIIQGVCPSFKVELLKGMHDFSTHLFKLALYSGSASLSPDLTHYVTANEIEDPDYLGGGFDLTVIPPDQLGSVGAVSFQNLSITTDTLRPRAGLIYNATFDNKAVMVLDFGFEQNPIGGVLNIRFPDFTASSAILRIT